MSDPNIDDFYGRLARIQFQHQTGHGFVAAGCVSRHVPRRQRRSMDAAVGPAILMFAAIICMKAVIHFAVGEATYDQRVRMFASGDGADRLAAFFVQADPLTRALSGTIRDILH